MPKPPSVHPTWIIQNGSASAVDATATTTMPGVIVR